MQILIDENENIKKIDFDLDKILSEYDVPNENRILEINNMLDLSVVVDNWEAKADIVDRLKAYSIEEMICALINKNNNLHDEVRRIILRNCQLFAGKILDEKNHGLDYNPKKTLLSCFRYYYTHTKNNEQWWEQFNEVVSSSIGVIPYFYEIFQIAIFKKDQNLIYFCKNYFDCFLSNIGYRNRKIYWRHSKDLQKMIFSNYDNLCNLYEILVHKDEIQDLLKTNIEVDTIDLIAKELFGFAYYEPSCIENIKKIVDILFLSQNFKNEFYQEFYRKSARDFNFSLVGAYIYPNEPLENKDKIYQMNLDCFIKFMNYSYFRSKTLSKAVSVFFLLVSIAHHENNDKVGHMLEKLPLFLMKFATTDSDFVKVCCQKLLCCIKVLDLYNVDFSLKIKLIEGLNTILTTKDLEIQKPMLDVIIKIYIELLVEKPEKFFPNQVFTKSYQEYFYDPNSCFECGNDKVRFKNFGIYALMREFLNIGHYIHVDNTITFSINGYPLNGLLDYYFSLKNFPNRYFFADDFNAFKEVIQIKENLEKITKFVQYFKIPIVADTEKINILLNPEKSFYKEFLKECMSSEYDVCKPPEQHFFKDDGNYTFSAIQKHYEYFVNSVDDEEIISTEEFNLLKGIFFTKPNADLFMSLFEYFKAPFCHLNTILNSIKIDLEKTQQNILASSISYCFNYFPYCGNKTKCIATLIDLFKKNMYVIDGCYYKDLKRTRDEDLYWAAEQNQITLAKTITFLEKNLTGYEKNIGLNIFHLLILNNRPKQMQDLVNFFIGYGETKLLKALLEQKSEFTRFDAWNNCTPLEQLNMLINKEKNKEGDEITNKDIKDYVSMKNTLEFAQQFVKNDKSLCC